MNWHNTQLKYKLVILQLALLGLVIVFFAIRLNWLSLFSALLGGSAWIIPSLYFSHQWFKQKADATAIAFNTLLLHETLKLLASAALIILFLLTIKVQALGFICGYIAVISAAFFLPFCYHPLRKA